MIKHQYKIQKQEQNGELQIYPSKNQNILNIFFSLSITQEIRNGSIAFLAFNLKLMLPLLIIASNLPQNYYNSMMAVREIQPKYSITIFIIILLIKLLIVVTILAFYHSRSSGSFIIKQIFKTVQNKLNILLQIDYNLSMVILSYQLNTINILNSILSLLLYSFAAFNLSNYISKQDILYCSSCKSNINFRLFLTLGYTLLAILFKFPHSDIIKVAITLFTVFLFVWYYQQGYQLYSNKTTKVWMACFTSLLVVANFLLIQKDIKGESKNLTDFFTNTILLFSFIFGSCFIISFNKDNTLQESIHILDIKRVLNNILINQTQEVTASYTFGLISYHKSICKNIQCQLHLIQLSNSIVNLNRIQQNKINSFKGFFRCLYENKLAEQKTDTNLLQYLQYLSSQMNPSPFKMMVIYSQINRNRLTLFERSTFHQLHKNIQSLLLRKMKGLYEGKLYFEQILKFEKHYQSIERLIKYLVKSNLQINKILNKNKINLQKIFQKINENKVKQQQLDKQWEAVYQQLKYQKWRKIIYLQYKQLIKNEQITRKDIQIYNWQQNQDQRNHNDENRLNCCSPSVIFQKEAVVFTCSFSVKELFFINANDNFSHYFGYNKQEFFHAPLEHIFSQQFKPIHRESFQIWYSGNLKCSYEDSLYPIREAQCLSNRRDKLNVTKYFKTYLNAKSQLQFVCMLRVKDRKYEKEILNHFQTNQFLAKQKFKIEDENEQLYVDESTQLSSKNAIFIKESTFLPQGESEDVTCIKIAILVFIVIMITVLVASNLLTHYFSIKMKEYSQQYITFMACYRIPMVLGNSYQSIFLNIGNQTKLAAQIVSLSAQFASLQYNPLIIKTLYDSNINIPAEYFPYNFGSNPQFSNDSQNQISIFYTISGSISSLKAPVNQNSQDFIIFDKFLTPSYDNMLNGTKHQFHASFVSFINFIISNLIIIIILQIILTAAFVTVLTFFMRSFFRKMKLISNCILNFKDYDAQIILKYWKRTQGLFNQLFQNSYNRQQLPPLMTTQALNVDSYINKTSKVLVQNTYFQNLNRIALVKIIVASLLILGCFLATQFNSQSNLNYLNYFENQGYMFLQYFPTATVVGYGCLSKYRSIHYRDIGFDPQRFEMVLSAMELVGQFEYIPKVKNENSLYFKKQKNYFFGNPCRYNPSVINAINVSVATCQSLINGSFTSGLTSYMRAGAMKARSYYQGKIDLNATQLAEFSSSVSVLSAYILDAINTWGTEFGQNITDLIGKYNTILGINLAVLLSISIIFFYCLIVRSLQQQYDFYRYMFVKMIPEYLLKEDKLVRQTFKRYKVLH